MFSRSIPQSFDGRRMNVKTIRSKKKCSKNTYSSDTLPTIKPTWTVRGSNSCILSEKPVTNYKRYVADFQRATKGLLEKYTLTKASYFILCSLLWQPGKDLNVRKALKRKVIKRKIVKTSGCIYIYISDRTTEFPLNTIHFSWRFSSHRKELHYGCCHRI
jgi:hypothetical protein